MTFEYVQKENKTINTPNQQIKQPTAYLDENEPVWH